ncbi:MAG: carbohydrate binding family 9 domain-containing protein [Candidatus Aminicenantales bacterium]
MKIRFRRIMTGAALAAAAFVPASLFALNTLDLQKTLKPPVIDGTLEAGEWDGAYTMTEFKTFKPDYGKDPTQKTEAYFLYDADNLYFAFRCYDTDPSKIKASLSKRDDMGSDDYVGVIVDTYNTMQNAYTFMVNPLGIQGDGIMTTDGNLTAEQDFIWDSKGQLDEQGYTVEYRIPLQSIRFPAGDTITIRLFVYRQFVRTSEMASVPPVYMDKGSILAQSQPIAVTGLKFKRVVEILPAITHSDRKAADQGALKRVERTTDLSLTAKVGLTTDLTLDAAINPDFSQVEADAGQVDVNLRYDLYYSEKRPFFLEGNEVFALAGNTEDAPLYGLVYTRTIVDPTFGFKLSGKLGASNSIAAIFARDNEPGAADEHPYFSIFRVKHSLKEDSYLGGYYTARDYEGGANRVVGVDGRIRTSPLGYADFHLIGSYTKAPETGETNSGHALGLHYNQSTRNYYLDFGYQDISPNFQVDTGFLERTGLRRLAACGILMFYPEKSFIQRYDTFYWSYHLQDTTSNMWETFNMFCLRFFLPGSSQVRFEGILANEVYEARRFGKSGYGFQFYTQLTKKLYLNSFFRHTGAIYYDPADPYQGDRNMVMSGVSFQPTDQLAFAVDLTYQDFTRRSDKTKIYDYLIVRSFNTYQINKYLFLRAIGEYNTYYKRWTVDTLASFTYIPGTVVYVGYGSAFEKIRWTGEDYVDSDRYLETKRGFFFKVSYLWRW